MPDIKPYLIVPNLIEQPTWGGDYISTLKQIQDPVISQMIIGQSYELYEHTNLSQKTSTKYLPSLEMADPSDPTTTQITSHNDQVFNINELLQVDPTAVLGSTPFKKYGKKITTLIKLTQAKGNSFQVHRKFSDPSDHWLPKPESWYYFEPGLVTLGVKPNIDWIAYQQVCETIDKAGQSISIQIKNEKLTLEQGRNQLEAIININHPLNFVNHLQVGKNQAIDLSWGGIHHSWEENDATHPQGNILYEIQENVYDPSCTIRGFDKGKIKNDGSIRPIHITDYFKYIDRSPTANDPQKYFTKGKVIKKTSTHTFKLIFTTPYYSLEEITFSNPVSNQLTTTSDSFHHLFLREGNAKVIANNQTWVVTQGYSIFIPANTGQYLLKPYKCRHAKVLKTYIEAK